MVTQNNGPTFGSENKQTIQFNRTGIKWERWDITIMESDDGSYIRW